MKIFNRLKSNIRKMKNRLYRKIDVLSIAVICDGGVGDCIVYLNYCKALKAFVSCKCDIDIYFKSIKTVEYLYDISEGYLHGYYNKREIRGSEERYDLVLWIKERFPKVEYVSWSRLKDFGEAGLFNLAQFYNDEYEKNRFFYDQSPRTDGFAAQLSVAQGFNRVMQPDLGHKLGITDIDINIPTKNDEVVLKKFGLESGCFVSINRSVDSTRGQWESTKLWPKNRYLELFSILQKKYPNLPLVYIGPAVEEYIPTSIKNLGGMTSFEELKIVLKHAKLHIGPEGGLIHMRHALSRKPSCVLFGPTGADFYGYSENVNFEKKCCLSQCEWLVSDWQERCVSTGSSVCKKLYLTLADDVVASIDALLQ